MYHLPHGMVLPARVLICAPCGRAKCSQIVAYGTLDLFRKIAKKVVDISRISDILIGMNLYLIRHKGESDSVLGIRLKARTAEKDLAEYLATLKGTYKRRKDLEKGNIIQFWLGARNEYITIVRIDEKAKLRKIGLFPIQENN